MQTKSGPRKGPNSVVCAAVPSAPTAVGSSAPKRKAQKPVPDAPSQVSDSALEVSGRLRLNGKHIAAIGGAIAAMTWLWLTR
jgi:hypothetical protein